MNLANNQKQAISRCNFRIWPQRRKCEYFFGLNEEYIKDGKQHRAQNKRRGEEHRFIRVLRRHDDHRFLSGDELQDRVGFWEWEMTHKQRPDSDCQHEAEVWPTV